MQEGKLRCAVTQWLTWGLWDVLPLCSAIFLSVAPQIPWTLQVLIHKIVLFSWTVTVWKKLSPWLTSKRTWNLEWFCWKVRELFSHIELKKKNRKKKSKSKKKTHFCLLPQTKCYFFRWIVTRYIKKIYIQSVMGERPRKQSQKISYFSYSIFPLWSPNKTYVFLFCRVTNQMNENGLKNNCVPRSIYICSPAIVAWELQKTETIVRAKKNLQMHWD